VASARRPYVKASHSVGVARASRGRSVGSVGTG